VAAADARPSLTALRRHFGHCPHEQDGRHQYPGQSRRQEHDPLLLHHVISFSNAPRASICEG
jgi:hypothetical protein